jgi:tetratricopeptide (TPR) repeat protein
LRDARVGLGLVLPDPDEFRRQLQRGLKDLDEKRFPEAVRHLKRALELQPGNLQATRGLRQARYGEAMADGRAALRDRRFAEAVRAFEKALAQVPGDPAATQALRQARAHAP